MAPDPGSGAPPRRRRIKPRSAKRAAARDDELDVAMAVVARDRRCLLEGRAGWGPCSGRPWAHHLRKQGQGGPWTLDNCVTLCSAHNGAVEDRPDDAYALGLVVRAGESTADAWRRMRAAGLVR